MSPLKNRTVKVYESFGKMKVELFFLRYAFPCAYICMQRGEITTEELDELEDIAEFADLARQDLVGINVTIPYKEKVMVYLQELSDEARQIGAVNTIKWDNGRLKGYNTDCYGFKKSILPYLKPHHKSALILGTGGASKAVAYVLKKLDLDFKYVSRNPINKETISYNDVTPKVMENYHVIINCTPLGTYPNIKD